MLRELARGLRDITTGRLSRGHEQLHRDLRALQQSVQRLADAQQTVFDRAARMERDASQIRLALGMNDRDRREIESLDTRLNFERVSTHIRSVVRSAELVLEPFPHIVVDRMWPNEIYQLIVRGIPPEPFFSEKDAIKQNIRIPMDFAPIFTARVWEFVDRASRECVVPEVLRKFREPLSAHYDTIFGEAFRKRAGRLPQSVSGGRLMLRRPGYHLDPHRDPKRAWLTCLMYLAKPGDSEAWGTQIFKVTGDQEAPYTQTYYPAQSGGQVELVKLVPFVPNTALIFLNSGGAHGADIPKDAPADLERYSFQFYIGPDSADLDALVRELPPDRRARWVSKSDAASRGM